MSAFKNTEETMHTERMPAPLESNFLVPNASFIVLAVLALIVVGLLVGGLVWLLASRRSATVDR